MRLLASTDFALRILLRLVVAPGRRLDTPGLAMATGVPRNHVHKIVQSLAAAGYVRTTRGSGGGVALIRPPAQIQIGAVVRHFEAEQALVECDRKDGGACPLTPNCALRGILGRARGAFLGALDSTSLADCLPGLLSGNRDIPARSRPRTRRMPAAASR